LCQHLDVRWIRRWWLRADAQGRGEAAMIATFTVLGTAVLVGDQLHILQGNGRGYSPPLESRQWSSPTRWDVDPAMAHDVGSPPRA
jgi:hypothetical protein